MGLLQDRPGWKKAFAVVGSILSILSILDAFIFLFVVGFMEGVAGYTQLVFFAIVLANITSIGAIWIPLCHDLSILVVLAVVSSGPSLRYAYAYSISFQLLHISLLWMIGHIFNIFASNRRERNRPGRETASTVMSICLAIPYSLCAIGNIVYILLGGHPLAIFDVAAFTVLSVNGVMMESWRVGAGAGVAFSTTGCIFGQVGTMFAISGGFIRLLGILICCCVALGMIWGNHSFMQTDQSLQPQHQATIRTLKTIQTVMFPILGLLFIIVSAVVINVALDMTMLSGLLYSLLSLPPWLILYALVLFTAWGQSPLMSGVTYISLAFVTGIVGIVGNSLGLGLVVIFVLWVIVDTIYMFKLKKALVYQPNRSFKSKTARTFWMVVVPISFFVFTCWGTIAFTIVAEGQTSGAVVNWVFGPIILSGWVTLFITGIARMLLQSSYYGLDVTTAVIFFVFNLSVPTVYCPDCHAIGEGMTMVLMPAIFYLTVYTVATVLVQPLSYNVYDEYPEGEKMGELNPTVAHPTAATAEGLYPVATPINHGSPPSSPGYTPYQVTQFPTAAVVV